MKTIFLQVAIDVIKSMLSTLSENSVKSDNGLFSSLVRNKELSKKKRNVILEYQVLLQNFEPKASDEENKLALEQLIKECREKGKNISSQKGYDEGEFGKGMQSILTYLEDFYDKLKQCSGYYLLKLKQDPEHLKFSKLEQLTGNQKAIIRYHNKEAQFYYLDILNQKVCLLSRTQDKQEAFENLEKAFLQVKQISKKANYDELAIITSLTGRTPCMLLNAPHDHTPFNIFRYHMVRYFSKKLEDSLKQSMFKKIKNNPNLTCFNKLSKQKECLIIEVLENCHNDLETLDKNHEKYDSSVRKRVLEHLKKMIQENNSLINQNGVETNIPIEITFFAKATVKGPALTPSPGELDDCINEAIEQIKNASKQINNLSMNKIIKESSKKIHTETVVFDNYSINNNNNNNNNNYINTNLSFDNQLDDIENFEEEKETPLNNSLHQKNMEDDLEENSDNKEELLF